MTVNTGGIRQVRAPRTKTKVRSVLRVMHGERWVGDILVDSRQRIWRHADTIPAAVVLKILFTFTRQAEPMAGVVLDRDTGWHYDWQLARPE